MSHGDDALKLFIYRLFNHLTLIQAVVFLPVGPVVMQIFEPN